MTPFIFRMKSYLALARFPEDSDSRSNFVRDDDDDIVMMLMTL